MIIVFVPLFPSLVPLVLTGESLCWYLLITAETTCDFYQDIMFSIIKVSSAIFQNVRLDRPFLTKGG